MRASNNQSMFAWKSIGAKVHGSLASALLASSPNNFRYSASIDRIPPATFARLFASTCKNVGYRYYFSLLTNSDVQMNIPIRANPWPIGYTGAPACSDNGCLVGIHLSSREDGLFRRVLPRYEVKISGPYDEFVAKDVIISVIVDNGGNLPPRCVPIEFHSDGTYGTEAISDDEGEAVESVRVETAQGAREGFVLFRRENIGAKRDDTYRWNKKDPCIFFYRNDVSREGFAVTIGWRLNRPCAHIEGFDDTVLKSCTPVSQMLAGCNTSSKAHPGEWAFKHLRKRVTVTATLDAWQWTVSISVGRPNCVVVHRPVEQVFELLTSEQHWDPVDSNPHDSSQLQRASQDSQSTQRGTTREFQSYHCLLHHPHHVYRLCRSTPRPYVPCKLNLPQSRSLRPAFPQLRRISYSNLPTSSGLVGSTTSSRHRRGSSGDWSELWKNPSSHGDHAAEGWSPCKHSESYAPYIVAQKHRESSRSKASLLHPITTNATATSEENRSATPIGNTLTSAPKSGTHLPTWRLFGHESRQNSLGMNHFAPQCGTCIKHAGPQHYAMIQEAEHHLQARQHVVRREKCFRFSYPTSDEGNGYR
ncbi:hypothetical protein BV22DRAFT_1194042 [Leucogyrophana mollusca]|uniref:Uncharacterized protein n=1 Tax=Leucogyrophana mollusca TaxID=85980 RepID=A0ACB8BNU7_9AGAM|nr:hypothetical protein BV22DRAFT_1194042 [Leucogyrophana mollusca]